LYKKLLTLNQKGNPEHFTFWLRKNKKQNTNVFYRFNFGGDPDNLSDPNGYTHVDVVKVGTSRTQLIGFKFTKSFTQCDFKIYDPTTDDINNSFKKEADKIGVPAPTSNEINGFIHYIKSLTMPFSPAYSSFDSTLLSWMENVYNLFFQKVKEYGKTAGNYPNFYKLLKIDDDLFNEKKAYNDEKFAENTSNTIVAPPQNANTVNATLSASASSHQQKHALSTNEIPLNQILYGSPGTGKTYRTVIKAIEILEPSNDLDWAAKKKSFDEFRDKEHGQIVFTTFHQSMSYEDFVEGIKP
jgi:hypothetical protein